VKKLRLDPEALAVEPFETSAAPREAEGAVRGFEMETRRQDSCGWTVCCPDTRLPVCSVTALC
jgi:hypothetical protein